MSGIAFLVHLDGAPADVRLIAAMTDAMAYRGPDGIAHHTDGSAALGHCAMHTSAESLDAKQPLTGPDEQTVVVLDGYIGNCDALRGDLHARGAIVRNRSDAELVLAAYAQWGAQCPAHIDGEYAFVIWDKRKRTIVCARDHHGLRPLFWHCDGRQLTVASDIAGVLAALPQKPALNIGYIGEIAVDETFSPTETVWTGVHRLPGAHVLTCQIGQSGPQLVQYWHLPTQVSINYRSDGEYFEHYRAVLSECVRQASRTHLPLAFEVSGGLDSSSLFCIADMLEQEGKLQAPRMAGYTLAGPDGTQADELEYARAVGAHLGRKLTEVPLFRPGLGWFGEAARRDQDMPPFPNAAMSIGMDRAIAGDGARVTINGVGGDQWLDGTHFYYRELLAAGEWRELFTAWREDCRLMGTVRASALFARVGPGSFLPRGLRAMRRRVTGDDRRDWRGTGSWLLPTMQDQVDSRMARYAGIFPAEYRDSYKLRKLLLPRWTQILDLISRQRAREGLENRSPMMARAFIEFSAATPERTRLRGGFTKYIHRAALAKIMPDIIVNRVSKAEFSTVFDYMDDDIRKECLGVSAPILAEIADLNGLKQLFDRYAHATIDERCAGELWGSYVSAQILKLREDVSP